MCGEAFLFLDRPASVEETHLSTLPSGKQLQVLKDVTSSQIPLGVGGYPDAANQARIFSTSAGASEGSALTTAGSGAPDWDVVLDQHRYDLDDPPLAGACPRSSSVRPAARQRGRPDAAVWVIAPRGPLGEPVLQEDTLPLVRSSS